VVELGCSNDQYLCTGNTAQKDWRNVLEQLAALPYVTQIQEVVWE